MRIAGRRELVRIDAELFELVKGEGMRSAGDELAALGDKNERSSMKFPAAKLAGVRGRWRIMLTS